MSDLIKRLREEVPLVSANAADREETTGLLNEAIAEIERLEQELKHSRAINRALERSRQACNEALHKLELDIAKGFR